MLKASRIYDMPDVDKSIKKNKRKAIRSLEEVCCYFILFI